MREAIQRNYPNFAFNTDYTIKGACSTTITPPTYFQIIRLQKCSFLVIGEHDTYVACWYSIVALTQNFPSSQGYVC